MAARDDLEYIDLADFTKGISTEYHSQTADEPGQDGYARAEQTYGCYGLKTGGLAPLPKAIASAHAHFDAPFLPPDSEWTWPVGVDYPDEYNGRIAVLDVRLNSPVQYSPPLSEPISHTNPPVNIHLIRQWWMVDAEGNPDVRWRWSNRSVYQEGDGYPGFDHLNISATESFLAAIDDELIADTDATFLAHPTRWGYGWGSLMSTRSSRDNAIYNTGVPITIASMGAMLYYPVIAPANGIDMGGQWATPGVGILEEPDEEGVYHPGDHPVPALPLEKLPDLYGTTFAGMVFGHQGRLCAITRESADYATRGISAAVGGNGLQGTNDILIWWPNNNVFAVQPPNIPVYASPPLIPDAALYGQFEGPDTEQNPFAEYVDGLVAAFSPVEEHVTGIGVYNSVDANTLLLIKNVGGGVQLTGDLDRPNVTRLPGVPSVGGITNRGAVTEQGFAYGSTSGVWMWSGGNTATNLAPHIDPLFWVPDDPTVSPTDPRAPGRQKGQLVGSFGYRFPYLYAPNNWVMDLRTGGWFRYWPTVEQSYDTGVSFAFNEVDSDGNLWAFPASHLDGSDLTFPTETDSDVESNEVNRCLLYRRFDLNTASSFYSWRSQPITQTRNRYLDFRQLVIAASGIGRVTVTLFGQDEATIEPIHIDLTSDRVSIQQTSIDLAGTTDIEVLIESRGGDDDTPAPVVHRVSLGFRQAQSIVDI